MPGNQFEFADLLAVLSLYIGLKNLTENEQKKSGVTPPAGMQAVWDWEHKNMVAKVAAIKSLIETAKKV